MKIKKLLVSLVISSGGLNLAHADLDLLDTAGLAQKNVQVTAEAFDKLYLVSMEDACQSYLIGDLGKTQKNYLRTLNTLIRFDSDKMNRHALTEALGEDKRIRNCSDFAKVFVKRTGRTIQSFLPMGSVKLAVHMKSTRITGNYGHRAKDVVRKAMFLNYRPLKESIYDIDALAEQMMISKLAIGQLD